MKICFDTNVVLDILARIEDYPESFFAYDVANLCKFDCLISASAVTDIVYAIGYSKNKSKAVHQALKNIFGLFSIFDVNESDCHFAADAEMANFEDAVLAIASKRNSIDIILTRNVKGFINSPVPIMTPQEFLDKFKPPNYNYELVEW